MLKALPAPPTVNKVSCQVLEVHARHCRSALQVQETSGDSKSQPHHGPFQIGESESSANTGATYDDEISSFFPSFPLRKKRIILWHS